MMIHEEEMMIDDDLGLKKKKENWEDKDRLKWLLWMESKQHKSENET